jgi:hypothetical protein
MIKLDNIVVLSESVVHASYIIEVFEKLGHKFSEAKENVYYGIKDGVAGMWKERPDNVIRVSVLQIRDRIGMKEGEKLYFADIRYGENMMFLYKFSTKEAPEEVALSALREEHGDVEILKITIKELE